MIRRAETDADFALCARIKNAVQPAEPVTAEELRDDPGARLLIHGRAGYAVVKESSVVDCAFTMVRVLSGERRRGIGSPRRVTPRPNALRVSPFPPVNFQSSLAEAGVVLPLSLSVSVFK